MQRAPLRSPWSRPPSASPRVSRALHRKCACASHALRAAECEECRQTRDRLLDGTREPAPTIVHDVLRSPGQPLDLGTRAAMEPRFGQDLSRVRVHTDGKAAESARAVNALAYTVGQDIVWGRDRYAPHTEPGRELLAHELAHAVQQRPAPSGGPIEIAESGGAAERQADAAASGVISASAMPAARSGPVLQRRPLDGGAAAPRRRGSTLTYRDARDLSECVRIMGSESLEYCRREVLHEDIADAPLAVRAQRVAADLTDLIASATWKEIRKRVYPKESAPGIQRAKARKAGTLPDLTGVGKISSLEHFAAAVRGVQGSWAALTPDERVQKLGKAAGDELTAADVPPFLVLDRRPMEFQASFSHHFWKFTISNALVTSGALLDEEAARVANATLHESRHAEQHFLAARFSAGQGLDAAAIHTQQDIPTTIAEKAVDKKFDAATNATVKNLGQRMFDAMVTFGAANQAISDDDGIRELAVRKGEAETALLLLNAAPAADTLSDAIAKRNALRAQIIEVERRYTLYRNIPYEADAHEVGDAAEQAFKGWP